VEDENTSAQEPDWFARNPRLGGLIITVLGGALLAWNMHTLRDAGTFGMKSLAMAPACMGMGLSGILLGKQKDWIHAMFGLVGLALGFYLIAGLKGSVNLPPILTMLLVGE
jgi:hypothetical protein